ncbi:MAG: oxidoreductase [Candidatus Omnitrophica bacterium]|nr:oxidoreductase [Candidatus Omnitrophota bacterium]
MKKNPYQSANAVLEDVITESPTIKTFVLRPEVGFGFNTGQFIELSLNGSGEAPFTPSSDPGIKEKIDITIMSVGRLTSKLHQLQKGEVLGIRGPYGKGYPLNEFKGKNILIVGGGVGLAPLRSLIYSLLSDTTFYKKIYLHYGAKTPQDIIYKDQINTWKSKIDIELSVDKADDIWKGRVGVVTTLLNDFKEDINNTISIVCGPPIMMKFTTFKLLDIGFKPSGIYLSMEKNMSCGIGKCGHCRIGRYYVCKDGPVFTYDKIKDMHDLWE